MMGGKLVDRLVFDDGRAAEDLEDHAEVAVGGEV